MDENNRFFKGLIKFIFEQLESQIWGISSINDVVLCANVCLRSMGKKIYGLRSHVIEVGTRIFNIGQTFKLAIIVDEPVWVCESDTWPACRAVVILIVIEFVIVVRLLDDSSVVVLAVVYVERRTKGLFSALLTSGQLALETCVNHLFLWHIVHSRDITSLRSVSSQLTLSLASSAHGDNFGITFPLATLFTILHFLVLETLKSLLKILRNVNAFWLG